MKIIDHINDFTHWALDWSDWMNPFEWYTIATEMIEENLLGIDPYA